MQVVVDGILTSYASEGNGSVVLLVHGWGDSADTFSALSAELKNSFTVVSVDLPGFGETETPKEVYDLEAYARFISAFLAKVDLTPSIAVGHSNGGAILLKAVAQNMIHIDRLVLLASAGVRSTDRARKSMLRTAAKVAKVPVAILPKKAQKKLKKRAYAAVGSDLYVAEHMQETFRRVVSEDVLSQSGDVTMPVLLVYGSTDTATPVAYGELLERHLPNGQLVVVDGAGHFLHHTHVSEVIAAVDPFIEGAEL